MCNTSLQQRSFNNVVDPFSFSTFQLLRTCNRLFLPNGTGTEYGNSYCPFNKDINTQQIPNTVTTRSATFNTSLETADSPILDVIETISLANSTEVSNIDVSILRSPIADETQDKVSFPNFNFSETKKPVSNNESTLRDTRSSKSVAMSMSGLNVFTIPGSDGLTNKPPLPAFEYITPLNNVINTTDFPLMELNRVGAFSALAHRRPRGEKRPIPEEQKDEKYYERRKRNNEAAKKSRDARKIREDRIAFRAALLEQENSLLRAQVMALRDELQTLRQLISTPTTTVVNRTIN